MSEEVEKKREIKPRDIREAINFELKLIFDAQHEEIMKRVRERLERKFGKK